MGLKTVAAASSVRLYFFSPLTYLFWQWVRFLLLVGARRAFIHEVIQNVEALISVYRRDTFPLYARHFGTLGEYRCRDR